MGSKSVRKKGSWYYRMTLSQKRGLWGLVFLAPWLLGFLLFFIRPLIDTTRYAFSTVAIVPGDVIVDFIGLDNFRRAFTIDPNFNQLILTLAFPALAMVAVVVIFSLLAAMLINGKYPGRSVVRTIFFMPIIMGASIATATIVGDDYITEATTAAVGFAGFDGGFFFQTLAATGLPAELTGIVNQAVGGIFGVLADSGVPVLIFLAGLQAIPSSLYEVAKIEGATHYEQFWKVTLPMISPMILLSTVYTIVDLFTRHQARVGTTIVSFFGYVDSVAFGTQNDLGLASAMVLVYVVVCLLIISIVTFFISKGVFYYD